MKKLIGLLIVSSVLVFGQSAGVGQIWTVVSGTLQSGATANGNGTALSINGLSSAVLTVNCSVACSGGTTINFEGAGDGSNYVALNAVQLGTGTIATTVLNQGTTITAWQIPIGGLQTIRARISAYSAGTITVTANATAAPYDPKTLNANEFIGGSAVSSSTVIGHVVVDTAPSTAVTNAGTFAVQSTNAAETTKVIGTVRVIGNTGATVDSAPQATAPTNGIAEFGAAVNAEQTAATNGQAQRIITDLVGKQIVLPYANPENFVMGTTAAITDTTSTSVIASAGGSLRNYITACAATNSHATVDTFVKILDGATIIWEELAVHGSGWNMTFPTPLRGTAATAVNAQMVTTGTNVIVSCTGYKGL